MTDTTNKRQLFSGAGNPTLSPSLAVLSLYVPKVLSLQAALQSAAMFPRCWDGPMEQAWCWFKLARLSVPPEAKGPALLSSLGMAGDCSTCTFLHRGALASFYPSCQVLLTLLEFRIFENSLPSGHFSLIMANRFINQWERMDSDRQTGRQADSLISLGSKAKKWTPSLEVPTAVTLVQSHRTTFNWILLDYVPVFLLSWPAHWVNRAICQSNGSWIREMHLPPGTTK